MNFIHHRIHRSILQKIGLHLDSKNVIPVFYPYINYKTRQEVFMLSLDQIENVKELFTFEIDPIVYKIDAFQMACQNGYLDTVKFLLEQKALPHEYNEQAFRMASANGHLEVVKCLLNKRVDLNANHDEAFRAAVQNGHLDVVQLLFEIDHEGPNWIDQKVNPRVLNEAFMSARNNGHTDIIQYLIEKKINLGDSK